MAERMLLLQIQSVRTYSKGAVHRGGAARASTRRRHDTTTLRAAPRRGSDPSHARCSTLRHPAPRIRSFRTDPIAGSSLRAAPCEEGGRWTNAVAPVAGKTVPKFEIEFRSLPQRPGR